MPCTSGQASERVPNTARIITRFSSTMVTPIRKAAVSSMSSAANSTATGIVAKTGAPCVAIRSTSAVAAIVYTETTYQVLAAEGRYSR